MRQAKFLFGRYLNTVGNENLSEVKIGVRWVQLSAEQKLDWIRFAEAVYAGEGTDYNHEGV